MLYRTYFNLTNSVIDFKAARDYLMEDNMKNYLKGDKRCSNETFDKIKSITWILKDEISGYIELITTSTLSQEELDNISDWVKGQNSDGIGEGFIDQNFVNIGTSFDWKTNNYKFELI